MGVGVAACCVGVVWRVYLVEWEREFGGKLSVLSFNFFLRGLAQLLIAFSFAADEPKPNSSLLFLTLR